MKAIIFGGTGFIGGHVAEQLHLAGHQVTAAVRDTSSTSFLETLGIGLVRTDFSDSNAIGQVIEGHDVVYNCTADRMLQSQTGLDAPVEINLARRLIEAAASCGAARFIQLSTVILYDFHSSEPMDETYISKPEYMMQKLAMERERIIGEAGRQTGITTMVLRPASTIGVRDSSSFFARLFAAHAAGQYPMIGSGGAKVSLVDTRDIGRAMVWLGANPKSGQDDGIYLLKGFNTTWNQLKTEIDRVTGITARTIDLPESLTDEQMKQFRLTSFAMKNLTVNRLWNDDKIRKLGFDTKYALADAVETAISDMLIRQRP